MNFLFLDLNLKLLNGLNKCYKGPKPLLFGQHRCHSIYLAFGGEPIKLIDELLQKKTGCTEGKGGSASIHSKKINMYGHDGLMGSNGPIGVGACFATNKPTIISIITVWHGGVARLTT